MAVAQTTSCSGLRMYNHSLPSHPAPSRPQTALATQSTLPAPPKKCGCTLQKPKRQINHLEQAAHPLTPMGGLIQSWERIIS